ERLCEPRDILPVKRNLLGINREESRRVRVHLCLLDDGEQVPEVRGGVEGVFLVAGDEEQVRYDAGPEVLAVVLNVKVDVANLERDDRLVGDLDLADEVGAVEGAFAGEAVVGDF